jgi:hypothetical protein
LPNTITTIHRILGEVTLLIALVGVMLAVVVLVRKTVLENPERILAIAFLAPLDLQALLGSISYFSLPALTRPTLLHPILMILAVMVVHMGCRSRKNPSPAHLWAQLSIYGLSLVLVFAGRMPVA